MSNRQFFSVIIPLYNKVEFVQKTVNSVLAQTHPNFELLVVDDGSTDESLSIIEKITDKRVRIIKQKNGGVSAARNRGISEAKYEIIAFLDADDWWDKEYLSSMSKLVLKYPDAGMYAPKYARVINGKTVVEKNPLFDDQMEDMCFDLIEMMVKKNRLIFPVNSSSIVIRKVLFSKAGCYDERIRNFEDWDLYLRLGIFGKIAYLNGNPLSFYLQDVPPEKRASMGKLQLNRHMVCYLDKFDSYVERNEYLRIYLDRFRLNSLRVFVENGWISKEECREILKNIDRSLYSWKDKMRFSFSVAGMLFMKLSRFRRHLCAKWLRS